MSSVNSVETKQSCSCDLLTWKNPIQTGKVFGVILAILLVIKFVNLFKIFFHVAYLGLLLAAALEYVTRVVTGQGIVSKYKPKESTWAKKFNHDILPRFAQHLEEFEVELQKIYYAHDIETTLKGAGICYIIYKITSWFSLYTITFVVFISVFTLPTIYLHNKKPIDDAVSKTTSVAKEKASEYSKIAGNKLEPQLKKLAEKSGPAKPYIDSVVNKFSEANKGTAKKDKSTGDFVDSAKEAATSGSSTGTSKYPNVSTSSVGGL